MLLQYLIIKDEKTAKIKDFKPESELVRMNCEELKVLKIKRSFYIENMQYINHYKEIMLLQMKELKIC